MMDDDEWGAVGARLESETEVLGENLAQCLFVYHKSHRTYPGIKPGLPRWEAGD
jgi:hypothetical protein